MRAATKARIRQAAVILVAALLPGIILLALIGGAR